MSQSVQKWHSGLLRCDRAVEAIAHEILKLLKLPVVMALSEFWCLEAIAQEYNQFDCSLIEERQGSLQLSMRDTKDATGRPKPASTMLRRHHSVGK